jgi:hypothetical protein
MTRSREAETRYAAGRALLRAFHTIRTHQPQQPVTVGSQFPAAAHREAALITPHSHP